MNKLSLQARVYVFGVILIGTALLVWNVLLVDVEKLWMIAVLSVLATASLVLKVIGATERSHYNISFLLYAFTLVTLGAPAAVIVVVISNLVEWAVNKYIWYIQSFNIASYLVAIELTGLVYEWINPSLSLFTFDGILGQAAAMATFTLVNHLMIGIVVWLARGENLSKSGVFDFLPLMIDFTLLCMGATAAQLWEISPFTVALAVLPIYLIYSTLKVPALERKTEIDPKTKLFNAEYFNHALESELERAHRLSLPLTVVMADMDLLRNINNTYGHLAGDEVLIALAQMIRESVRAADVAARFGGEEFAILIPEKTPVEMFYRVEELRKRIEANKFIISTSVTPIHVTMSFGLAGCEGNSISAKDVVHNADTALYHSKLTGRNRSYIYSSKGSQEFLQPPEAASGSHIEESNSRLVEEKRTGQTLDEATRPVDELHLKACEYQKEIVEIPENLESGLKHSIGQEEKPPGKAWFVDLYVVTLTLIAIMLFSSSFTSIAGTNWIGLAAFAVAVVLTEWLSVDIYVRDTAVSTSAAPILAGTLLFGSIGAIVMSLTFAVVALLKHKSKMSRMLFNFSNQLVAGMLYTLLLQLTGKNFTDWGIGVQLLLGLMSAGIVFSTTTYAVALGISLDQRLSVRSVWIEKFSWLAPYYVGMGLLGFALIMSYQYAGVIGIGVLLAPLLLMRFSQKQYIERTKDMVVELKAKNQSLEKSAQEISMLNEGLFGALAEAIDLRDPYVLGHSHQVTSYAVLVAQKLGLSKTRIEAVRKGSLLHDIGKLGIPDAILRKPTTLTHEEYAIIKTHSVLGAEILAASQALRELIPIVRHHHEHYDGKGYPDGLKGEEIPLEARIVSLADAVEAMASDRPYRRALDYSEIIEEIERNSGTQFDPKIAKLFLDVLNQEGEILLTNTARRGAARLWPDFIIPERSTAVHIHLDNLIPLKAVNR